MTSTKTVNGVRVAELRCERGMTQHDLAAKLGVSVRTIGNVERAKPMPDLSVLIALADLFEVSLDYLVGRTATP